MRISAISSNYAPSGIQKKSKNYNYANYNMNYGCKNRDISFRGYEEVFKKANIFEIENVKQAEEIYRELLKSLIKKGIAPDSEETVVKMSVLDSLTGLKQLFKTGILPNKVYTYAKQDEKTYIDCDRYNIHFYYPYKEKAEHSISFNSLYMDDNVNEVVLVSDYQVIPGYLRFWENTGNRKAINIPASGTNYYFKKDGSPNEWKNFFLGAY